MARGRKRKAGPRCNGKSDRPSRAAIGPDRGNTQTQAKHDRYGQDGVDAIGRAYCSGLLGEGNEAKALLDTARALSHTYRQTFTIGPITCAIATRTYGNGDPEYDRTALAQAAIKAKLTAIARKGWRAPFYELVIEQHPDSGPQWVDRLITKQARPADRARLAIAIEAIALVA